MSANACVRIACLLLGGAAADSSAQIPSVDALAARLPALIDSAGIPGLAATVLVGGKPVRHISAGVREAGTNALITRNTVFEAASLSKPVIAYMTLRLVDQGKLSLDQPLSELLPLADLSDTRRNAITARMVLTHTTGLQNERIGTDKLSLAFDPGEQFRYSGEGYTYLGHVLEKITGHTLTAAARRLVFDPLGMKRSSFVWEDRFADAAIGHGNYTETRTPGRPRVARGAATLHTTADDYASFMSAIARGEGLSIALRNVMLSPLSKVAETIAWTAGWGLEIRPGDSAIWHHGDNSGSGFTAFAWLDARTGKGIVYLANSTTGLSIVREILDAVSEGSHPSAEWINRERFNSPARAVRTTIYRHAVRHGAAAALAAYRDLKPRGPPDAFNEGLLNTLGYRFLDLERPNDAILFFEENVRAFPASANAYDSLGDGLAAGGRNKEAVEAYRRSSALDPKNTHALEMIKKLDR